MKAINQQIVTRVLEIVDSVELSRESVRIPLLMTGDGHVRRLADGKFEVQLPAFDSLEPFLGGLALRLLEVSG